MKTRVLRMECCRNALRELWGPSRSLVWYSAKYWLAHAWEETIWVWEKNHPTRLEIHSLVLHIPYSKISSKWAIGINVKQYYKILEKNRGRNTLNLELDKEVLDLTPKAWPTGAKGDMMDIRTLKSYSVNTRATDWMVASLQNPCVKILTLNMVL